MLEELDIVVLEQDIRGTGLKRGDIGAVVHVHSGGEAFEVEFVTLDGGEATVITVEAGQVRPAHPGEIARVRELESGALAIDFGRSPQAVSMSDPPATLTLSQKAHTESEMDEQLFSELAHNWKRDTVIHSNPLLIASHDAYQRIVGMGPRALPLILRDLKENGGYWYWALRAITGNDPVPDAHRGDVEAMTEHWLEWGRARGLLNGD